MLDGDVEAYFEPRHVIDVLTEFRHAKPPLPKVRWRLFSFRGWH